MNTSTGGGMDGNRRIDCLVASNIMGWNKMPIGSWSHQANRIWSVNENQIPHYSSDIRQAWNVVEKMRATELRTVIIPDWGTEWNAEIYKREVLICQSRFLKSAPLAICVAALKAVGVDADQIESALEAK